MQQRLQVPHVVQQTGGAAARQGRRVGVDHRIGQTAGARHNRQRAIAQTIELGQPARFEARGNKDGIRTALHEVRQALVIADHAAHRVGIGARGGLEARLQIAIAGAQHHQLGTAPHQRRDRLKQQVQPFLPGQAADNAKQRLLSVGLDAKALGQCCLVGRLALQIVPVIDLQQ